MSSNPQTKEPSWMASRGHSTPNREETSQQPPARDRRWPIRERPTPNSQEPSQQPPAQNRRWPTRERPATNNAKAPTQTSSLRSVRERHHEGPSHAFNRRPAPSGQTASDKSFDISTYQVQTIVTDNSVEISARPEDELVHKSAGLLPWMYVDVVGSLSLFMNHVLSSGLHRFDSLCFKIQLSFPNKPGLVFLSTDLIRHRLIDGEVFVLLGLERRNDQSLCLAIGGGKHSQVDTTSFHTALREFEEETGNVIAKRLGTSALWPTKQSLKSNLHYTYWAKGKYVVYFSYCGQVHSSPHPSQVSYPALWKWARHLLAGGKKNPLYQAAITSKIRNLYIGVDTTGYRSYAKNCKKERMENRLAYAEQQRRRREDPEFHPDTLVVDISSLFLTQPRVVFPQFPYTHMALELAPPPAEPSPLASSSSSFDDDSLDPKSLQSLNTLMCFLFPLLHHHEKYLNLDRRHVITMYETCLSLQASLKDPSIHQSIQRMQTSVERGTIKHGDSMLNPFNLSKLDGYIQDINPLVALCLAAHRHNIKPTQVQTPLASKLVSLWPPAYLVSYSGQPFFFNSYYDAISQFMYLSSLQKVYAPLSQSKHTVTLQDSEDDDIPAIPEPQLVSAFMPTIQLNHVVSYDAKTFDDFDYNLDQAEVDSLCDHITQTMESPTGTPVTLQDYTPLLSLGPRSASGAMSSSQSPSEPTPPAAPVVQYNPDEKTAAALSHVENGYDQMLSMHWVSLKSIWGNSYLNNNDALEKSPEDSEIFKNYSNIACAAAQTPNAIETRFLAVTSNGMVFPLSIVAREALSSDSVKELFQFLTSQ